MSHFFKLGFTPCKVEQSLLGMELQEKDGKDKNHRGKLYRKDPKKKRFLLTLGLKPFRS